MSTLNLAIFAPMAIRFDTTTVEGLLASIHGTEYLFDCSVPR